MGLRTLIMAGGQASRMGGCDKGLVLYKGGALIDHVIWRLNLPLANIAISANRNKTIYARRAAQVFQDLPLYHGCGPLAALASAAVEMPAQEEWLLVVPCDTPDLPPDMPDYFLKAGVREPECLAFYASTEERSHYSIMLLRPILLHRAARYLLAGKRSLRGWLEEECAQAVVFPNEADFRNYNTLQDLEDLSC